MNTVNIALRIATNEQARQALSFSREVDSLRAAKRRAHLRRQSAMLQYALLSAVNEPKVPSLGNALAVLNHCAGIDHLIPEIIDGLTANPGSRAGLHARHRAFRENAEAAIGRYADFLIEVQQSSDDAQAEDIDLGVSRLIMESLGTN